MSPKLLLRVASFLIFIHALAHTISAIGWKKTDNQRLQHVINTMTCNQFLFMGSIKSIGDYFEGYGYACSLALILMLVILWLLSAYNNELSRKVSIFIGVILIAWGINELIYFFYLLR